MIDSDYYMNLNEKLQEKALKELNENPEIRKEYIDTIRQWIIEHNDFFGRTDDAFILAFLRNCKFNLEKTKKRITKYYMARKAYADWNLKTDVELNAGVDIAMSGAAAAMNYAGGAEENIIFIIPRAFNHRKYEIEYIPITCNVGAEFLLLDVRTQINGVHVVIDCKGITVEQVFKVKPWQLWRFIYCAQNVAPIRIKGVHVLHMPTILNTLVTFGKRFANKKMRNRLHFYGSNLEAFHKVIKPEWLPEEYGGTCGSFKKFQDEDLEKFTLLRDYFKEDAKYGMI